MHTAAETLPRPATVTPLSPEQTRQLVEAALAMGAAGSDRPTIERALRGRGCPEIDVARLATQSLRFGDEARRARHEEAIRARTRAARKASAPGAERGRELAWTLSISAAGVGAVLGALVFRLAS
ncbi:MAG: hypothetical protein AB7P21_26600 [Lautropia sp.]